MKPFRSEQGHPHFPDHKAINNPLENPFLIMPVADIAREIQNGFRILFIINLI